MQYMMNLAEIQKSMERAHTATGVVWPQYGVPIARRGEANGVINSVRCYALAVP